MHDLHNSESSMYIGDFGRYNLVFLHVESTIFGRGGESGEERRAEPTGTHPVPPSGRLTRWRPFFYTVMNGNIHLIARNIPLGWINILTLIDIYAFLINLFYSDNFLDTIILVFIFFLAWRGTASPQSSRQIVLHPKHCTHAGKARRTSLDTYTERDAVNMFTCYLNLTKLNL